jgi:hypothetical protein
MGLGIIIFIVGAVVFVGGWTYFLNYKGDGSDDVRWGIEGLPYVIFLLLGSNRPVYRVFVCLLGVSLMAGGRFGGIRKIGVLVIHGGSS